MTNKKKRNNAWFKRFEQSIFNNTNQKSEQFVSTMPAVKKDFSLLGDNIIDIFAENDALKDKIGSHEQHWLEESKAKLLKHIDDEKRAKLIMSKMKKQMEKH